MSSWWENIIFLIVMANGHILVRFIFTPRNRIYHFMQNDLFRCGLNISNLHMQMINYCARVSLLTCWQKCAQILHLKAKVILALLCFCFRWYLLFRIAFEILKLKLKLSFGESFWLGILPSSLSVHLCIILCSKQP